MSEVAIVAGGSGGIGNAISERLAMAGYEVASVSRSRRPGDGKLNITADLTSLESTESAVAEIRSKLGQPRVVIHSVGDIYDQQPLYDADWDRWLRLYSVCVGTAVHLGRVTFNDLASSAGCFVAVSSIASHHHYEGITDYCAAKAALEAYVRGLATELAPYSARAVTVSPAVVDTELFRRSPYSVEEAATWHKLGRIGSPGDVAEIVTFLVSSRASWITGTSVTLDGGMTL